GKSAIYINQVDTVTLEPKVENVKEKEVILEEKNDSNNINNDSDTRVTSSDEGYRYFGKTYSIKIENGKGIEVIGYKGKKADMQKLLNHYNTNPDVDPQNGKQFRNFTK